MSFRRLIIGLLALTLAAGGAVSAATSSASAASTLGKPPRSYTIPNGNYFSFPNRTSTDRIAIRNRVLLTIESVWGGPHNSLGEPSANNGTIHMATWSFTDWSVAKALVAAKRRGVTVQIVAAHERNQDDPAWRYLMRNLGSTLYKAGHPETAAKHSWARWCAGSCRGGGGTPHSKFFLFDNVGSSHLRHVVVNTSMNLTTFAFQGQWNQAQVQRQAGTYTNFLNIFRQMGRGRAVSHPYQSFPQGTTTNIFFPAPGMTGTTDPVMKALSHVNSSCMSQTSNGTRFRTRIRIIQYAIYDKRGLWLAKRLRSLWNHGCNVGIIYSLSTRPVISILRSHTGRGPIPMKQSVITNSKGQIVKYNHSKWMAINGNYFGKTNNYMLFSGSANWSNAAFANDEQMQQTFGYTPTAAAIRNFGITWKQSSSHAPGYGRPAPEGRAVANARATNGVGGYADGNTIPFGTGAYKYLTADGD